MRYADIKDEKILAEQQKILEDYFENAPEGSNIDSWFDKHASDYYKNFMKDFLADN